MSLGKQGSDGEYTIADGKLIRYYCLAVALALWGLASVQDSQRPDIAPAEMEAFYEERIRECKESKRSLAGSLDQQADSGTLTSGMSCAGAPRGC